MATSTNSNTSKGYQNGYEQPSYQPWDDQKGLPSYSRDEGRDSIGNHDNGQGYNDRHNSAVDSLRDAEQSAVSRREPGNQASNNNRSFYTGKGKEQEDKSKKPSLKGKMKGKGALITIAIMLLGGGVFLSASNSLLGPAISALATANTQVANTSYTLRSKYIMSNMLTDTAGGNVTTGFTGKVKYTKIPNYMRKRLAANGFEVTGSGNNTRLSWTHTTKSGGTETISGIDAQEFLRMYNDDVEFRNDFTKAKRGRVATFFDNIADKIYSKLGLSRNWFANYRQTQDADADLANYKDTLSPKFDNNSTNIRTNIEGEKQATDANGDPIFETDADGNRIPVMEPDSEIHNATSKPGADAQISAGKYVGDIANTVGDVGSWACTATKVGGMIAMTASAVEMYQSINFFMGLVENISKMKFGYGDASAFNTLMNFLSTSATASIEDYANYKVGDFSNHTSDFASAAVATIKETGSPLESAGLQSFLANQNGNTLKSRTKNYSLERIFNSMGGTKVFGKKGTTTCIGVDVGNSLLSIGTAIATGGASVVAGFFAKFAFSIATTVAVSGFLSFLVPTLAKVLFSNTFDDAIGIPAGELFARGASLANQKAGKAGSGLSLTGKDQAMQFSKATNEVLALEAEQDRYNLSPFDTSNPNTFFGSIAYSLLPTITSTNTNSISSLIRSAGKSLSSLLGGVSAAGEDSSYITTFGDCPMLEEIGAVGGAYCDPLYSADMDTIYMDPDDETYEDVLMEAGEGAIAKNLTCDTEGNCEINDGSNLAKYITYCDGRDSPPGFVDQNILASMQLDGGVILNSLPLASDGLALINAAQDVVNMSWADGEKCGNTDQNSEFWESEGKYYYRYIEDQRILEQMGAYEDSQNPVTAYEEKIEAKYLEEHPEANTYIGYLSRISGLTPKNIETVVAFVAYYTFLDGYDPSVRIASEDTVHIDSGEEVVAKVMREHIRFESGELVENPIEDKTIAREYIIYADVRNRSYAA